MITTYIFITASEKHKHDLYYSALSTLEHYNVVMDDEFKKFEIMVTEAIDNIPEPYKSKINNVNFKVEESPTEQQRAKLGLRPCDALFGLYEGVPLTGRGGAVHSLVPDVITIFRYPMTEILKSDESLKKQIFKTVWHEVAHYFGLNHERIHKIESKI